MELGKYELVSRLALGGMAEVFLAKAAGPMGFEKTLVVKRILSHLAEDPTFVEMFLSEARLAAQLNHPNIVQIFDFGEADGEYILAMEYIDGPNLRVLLKKARAVGQRLPPALCARIIACACEGLTFAHDFQDPTTGEPLGLIHRDISADNILVSRQGAVKIVDFGIAKAAGQGPKTQCGIIKGKVAYMSPEQIRARPLDRRADVYALGVVFYELLTGRKPFEASTDASLMQAILSEPVIPAVRHRPDISAPVQHILERALAKDRERRYPDCRAFQLELEEFILSTGRPVGAYELSRFISQLSSPNSTPATAWKDTGEIPAQAATAKGPTRTVKTPTPQFTAAGTLPQATQALVGPEPLPAEPPAIVPPSPGARSATSRLSPKWFPVLLGAALLMTGGGYLAGSTMGRTEPMPLPPPVAATASQPVLVATAPQEQADAAPVPSSTPATSEPSAPPSAEPVVEQQAQQPDAETSAQPAPRKEPPVTAPTARSKREDTRNSAARTGTLRLVVRGWADIWVDGEKKGRVPPINELKLSAGRHELQLINPAVKPYRAIITITAGKTLEHRVLFQPSGGPSEGAQAEASARR
jgi:eukaryotic-like serine/threonine-protein kinase